MLSLRRKTPGSDFLYKDSSLSYIISHVKTLALSVSLRLDLAPISQTNTLSFRVSGGRYLALMSNVRTQASHVSREGILTLISHVQTLDFRVLALISYCQESYFQSLWRKRPGQEY